MEFPNGVFADFDEGYVLGSGCFAKLIFFFALNLRGTSEWGFL
jgi:hypothetical protein